MAGEDEKWNVGSGTGLCVDATLLESHEADTNPQSLSNDCILGSYVVTELPAIVETNFQFPVLPDSSDIFGHKRISVRVHFAPGPDPFSPSRRICRVFSRSRWRLPNLHYSYFIVIVSLSSNLCSELVLHVLALSLILCIGISIGVLVSGGTRFFSWGVRRVQNPNEKNFQVQKKQPLLLEYFESSSLSWLEKHCILRVSCTVKMP